ncbi:hypothetical protein ASD36_16890 [Rhizobium sp. Root1334]|nr:hypothetical protein ASD36_16890 [Rhizobium sp. Root1334]
MICSVSPVGLVEGFDDGRKTKHRETIDDKHGDRCHPRHRLQISAVLPLKAAIVPKSLMLVFTTGAQKHHVPYNLF